MKSIKEILETIFVRISVTHKWQQDFLTELFQLVFSVQGRINYTNLARYSKYNESTFRRNFKKVFDWLNFNLQLMQLSGLQFSDAIIAAIDCSYLPKAGKHTFGLDYYFSGTAGRNKKGLEVSLLSLIDVNRAKAWTLDAVQTPAKLSAKQGDSNTYTRIDFYREYFINCVKLFNNYTFFFRKALTLKGAF